MKTISHPGLNFRDYLKIPERYGKAPYFWLLSFVIFGWKYIYVAPSLKELGWLLLTLLVFMPLYLLSFRIRGRIHLGMILIICLFGIVWAPYNYGGSTFCIFAASMCSRIESTKRAYACLAILCLIIMIASYAMKLESFFWIPALIFGISSGISAIIGERLLQSKEHLLRKQEEVEHLAALAERERIARDMHDLLGHNLSVITLKAELARKLFDRDSEACKQEIIDIERTARQALAEVRHAISGYRETGLVYEIQNARQVMEAAQVVMETEIESFPMPPAVENIFALTLREAMTNIIRHAHASQCKVSLRQQDTQSVLHISDNGVAAQKEIRKGSGLTGMSERASALGGSLTIHTDQGMHLILSLPAERAT